MQRVERHIINTKGIDNICFLSKNLYNRTNYILRQSFTHTRKLPSEYELTGKFARRDSKSYRALPAQTSQQIIKLLYKNWKAFFASVKDYKKHPNKYLGRPNLPRFKAKNGKNIVIFTKQQISIKEGYIHFPKMVNLQPIKTKVNNIQQVRIIPTANTFVVEVVYEKQPKTKEPNNNFLSIDLGLNNLATSYNNVGKPFIVNGKVIKSINQYYNKKLAKLKSIIKVGSSKRIKRLTLKRNNKINDYLHKTSRYIINYCLANNIYNIIVGNNKEWKQEINLGKRNNQNFVSIPFDTLIQQLKYKSEDEGLNFITTEESYTSKIDHYALEDMCHQDTYLGRRVKRGLFQSSTKKLINADLNGAIGIARKVANDVVLQLISRGEVSTPSRISL